MGRPLRAAARSAAARVWLVARRRSGARTVRRACSHAHVAALARRRLIDAATADGAARRARTVAAKLTHGAFAALFARSGASKTCTARSTRACAKSRRRGGRVAARRTQPQRSGRDDARCCTCGIAPRGARARCTAIARDRLLGRERTATPRRCSPATTHWQPAQPVLLAFWLHGRGEGSRAPRAVSRASCATRCESSRWVRARCRARPSAGSAAAAASFGFARPSRNALDAVGDRDVALDLLARHRARVDRRVAHQRRARRFGATPAFGYVRFGDAASTGSSLMPQKRNPDPFELRALPRRRRSGRYAGALATVERTARFRIIAICKTPNACDLRSTERGLARTRRVRARAAHAHVRPCQDDGRRAGGFTVATDVADALIAQGMTARAAHALVGETIARSEARWTCADEARPATEGRAAA